jgi:hypothetical protein
VLTLYMTPVLYIYMEQLADSARRLVQKIRGPAAARET